MTGFPDFNATRSMTPVRGVVVRTAISESVIFHIDPYVHELRSDSFACVNSRGNTEMLHEKSRHRQICPGICISPYTVELWLLGNLDTHLGSMSDLKYGSL